MLRKFSNLAVLCIALAAAAGMLAWVSAMAINVLLDAPGDSAAAMKSVESVDAVGRNSNWWGPLAPQREDPPCARLEPCGPGYPSRRRFAAPQDEDPKRILRCHSYKYPTGLPSVRSGRTSLRVMI